MAKRKNLPKGLCEFQGAIQDLNHASLLLPRLLDLPEQNFDELLAQFKRASKIVEQKEYEAKMARELARGIAQNIWKIAAKNWSVSELQAATGYDEE